MVRGSGPPRPRRRQSILGSCERIRSAPRLAKMRTPASEDQGAARAEGWEAMAFEGKGTRTPVPLRYLIGSQFTGSNALDPQRHPSTRRGASRGSAIRRGLPSGPTPRERAPAMEKRTTSARETVARGRRQRMELAAERPWCEGPVKWLRFLRPFAPYTHQPDDSRAPLSGFRGAAPHP